MDGHSAAEKTEIIERKISDFSLGTAGDLINKSSRYVRLVSMRCMSLQGRSCSLPEASYQSVDLPPLGGHCTRAYFASGKVSPRSGTDGGPDLSLWDIITIPIIYS